MTKLTINKITGKVYITSGGDLDAFYNQTLQYFQDVYHNDPTQLTGKPPSAAERARLSYYDAMAGNAAGAAGRSFNPGKDIA